MSAVNDPVLERIPHRPPWLLIDRVTSVAGERVEAERRLAADDPLCADGLPETLVVEALAQTAACLMGHERGAHRGYLVAAAGFEFHGRAQAGETLTLSATRTAALGALHRFDGEAHVGARLVARGQMTFAVQA
jgi:3-hydroxyacyl-[acyl-carrier-protein] dehydratase